MADLNQFLRSKERLCEMLNEVVHLKAADSKTIAYIQSIEHSIKILDEKIAEYLGLDEFQSPDANIFFGLA
jgi:hypothetical protein